MATQYEVEHNIKPSARDRPARRQVDMSTFMSHLHAISPASEAGPAPAGIDAAAAPASAPGAPHRPNPHAVANPVDMAALFRLVQHQLATLLADAPDAGNRDLLQSLAESLEGDIHSPPERLQGVTQEYLDGLDRVPRKRLSKADSCGICTETYLDDPYCLVVELPCHPSHRFDLECVGPWLLTKGSCPLCRKSLVKKKEKEKLVPEDDEEEDDGGMYA